MSPTEKPLVWLHGEVKSPPFSAAARLEAGVLLRRLQKGEMLSLTAMSSGSWMMIKPGASSIVSTRMRW